MGCPARRHHSEPTMLSGVVLSICWFGAAIAYFPGMTRCERWLAFVFKSTEVPRLISNVDITARSNSDVI